MSSPCLFLPKKPLVRSDIMNKKMIFLILVFFALSFIFSKTIFKRDFVLPEEKGLFSQEVKEEIVKRVKPDSQIYLSGVSMYENSFSIGLLAPTKNPSILKYWFIIYNDTPEFMEKNGNHAYKLYYSGTVQNINLTGKIEMEEGFLNLEKIHNHKTEIFQAISQETEGESWYDIRMNENNGNLDQFLYQRVTTTNKGKSTYEDEMIDVKDLETLADVKYYILKGGKLEARKAEELKPDYDLFMVYEGEAETETTENKTLKGILKIEKE